MPVLKVKGMRRWCPAVSISSCLSLISILRGNVAGLSRLNKCLSLGEKVVCLHFFPFGNGVSLSTSVWMCLVSWSEVDITLQFMPTGWQAGSLKDRPFSMLSSSFLFHICIINSEHPLLHYLLHFFFFFLPFKQTI